MVITDIKNTKIRVKNEAHSKAIQEDVFDMGYAWDDGSSTFFSNRSFIFFDDGLEIMSCDAHQTFSRDKAKEIWFYNGEFHDKPQDKLCDDVEWKNGDECVYKHIKDVTYTYVGAHPSKQGHFVFNEEKGITYVNNDYLEKPISKEEIEKQERLEAAYDLYLCWAGEKSHKTYEEFINAEGTLRMWLRVVDKTGYRKGEL